MSLLLCFVYAKSLESASSVHGSCVVRPHFRRFSGISGFSGTILPKSDVSNSFHDLEICYLNCMHFIFKNKISGTPVCDGKILDDLFHVGVFRGIVKVDGAVVPLSPTAIPVCRRLDIGGNLSRAARGRIFYFRG
jgi:hypothetical protein